MNSWNDDPKLLRALRREVLSRGWVKNSVVGSGLFNANGVEVGVSVDWVDTERVNVSDGGDAWSGLWMSNLVRKPLRTYEVDRFDRVAKGFGLKFNQQSKALEQLLVPAQDFAEVALRVAAASLVVDGWRFVLEPHRRVEEAVQTRRVIEQVTKFGKEKEWRVDERVEIDLARHDRTWTARAALARDRSRVAIIPLSDDAADVAPRVAAWVDNATVPLVFLALDKNFEAARQEIASDKARVVKRSRDADIAAREVLESAEALAQPIAA